MPFYWWQGHKEKRNSENIHQHTSHETIWESISALYTRGISKGTDEKPCTQPSTKLCSAGVWMSCLAGFLFHNMSPPQSQLHNWEPPGRHLQICLTGRQVLLTGSTLEKQLKRYGFSPFSFHPFCLDSTWQSRRAGLWNSNPWPALSMTFNHRVISCSYYMCCMSCCGCCF